MRTVTIAALVSFALLTTSCPEGAPDVAAADHFDAKGKPPSQHTIAKQQRPPRVEAPWGIVTSDLIGPRSPAYST